MRHIWLFLLLIIVPFSRAQDENSPRPIDAVNYRDSSIVVLFDDGHYVIYPLPDGVRLWVRDEITLQADGNILISYDFDEYSQTYQYVLINAYTGEVQDVPLACGTEPFTAPEEAKWIYVEENGITYLCSTATDERRQLPLVANWMPLQRSQSELGLSPNGEWLILFGLIEDSPYNDFTLYSYELGTNTLRYLGYIEYETRSMFPPQVANWVSDTLGAVRYDIDGEWSSNPFYVFDASQENSLELALNGWVYDFYEDPLRYEYLETEAFVGFKTGSESPEHISCTLMIYDEAGLRNFDLGYDCGSRGYWQDICTVLYPVENGYIYLRFDSRDALTSTITFVDYYTGEKRDILSGEIEAISSVDENMVYYLADDNGQFEYHFERGCPLGDSFEFGIEDTFSLESIAWH